jgi:hypothetical protein
MKIVNGAAFLALPAEALFSKYEPFFFGELMIKGESLAPGRFGFSLVSFACGLLVGFGAHQAFSKGRRILGATLLGLGLVLVLVV